LYDQFQNIVYIGQAGNGNASPGLDSSKPSIKMVHSVHNKMLNQAYLVSNTLMLWTKSKEFWLRWLNRSWINIQVG